MEQQQWLQQERCHGTPALLTLGGTCALSSLFINKVVYFVTALLFIAELQRLHGAKPSAIQV